MGINNRGNVLGYSFSLNKPYRERVGVWNSKGEFKIYSESSTSSNYLVFNDNNQIIISKIRSGSNANNSYLVPKPGVRLNIADLVENLPVDAKLYSIYAMNNPGDMLGVATNGDTFLLQRIDGFWGWR